VSALIGLLAAAAGADTPTFTATGTVSVAGERSTVRFVFSGSKEPSDIRVFPCTRADVISASGPQGTKSSPTGSGGPNGQTGVKFQEGKFGSYTVVFAGRVFRADVVVHEAHRQTVIQLGNSSCSAPVPPVTLPPTTATTAAASPAGGPPRATPPAGGTAAPSVLGREVTRSVGAGPAAAAGTEVQGTSLAFTGPHSRLLLLLAGLAFALGGMALIFGEPKVLRAATVPRR
jgi:hypothetical protein